MYSFKNIWGFRNLRLSGAAIVLASILWLCSLQSVVAETCIAPTRPFVPSSMEAVREFRELIKNDFEQYIQDVQQYFGCIDAERVQVLQEAHEVSQEYARFLEIFDH